MESSILIVDDEILSRKALRSFLMPHGYQLYLASNGIEALEQAKQVQPDLILLDVMMPQMDGYEVCRRIRADPNISQIPVIMITALADRESRLTGIESGADDFISKPFDIIEFQSRVKTITRLNRYRTFNQERIKFEWVVDQADDGYVVINTEGKPQYINPQAQKYLGVHQENSKLTFLEIVQQQYDCEPSHAWATWPQETQPNQPLYLIRPTTEIARTFWLEVQVMAMPSQNQYLARLRDVTAVVTDQKLKWSFHHQISHKLRNPLGLITTPLQLMEETHLLSQLPPEAINYLQLMNDGAKQLQNNINRIFEYIEATNISRLDSGRCNIQQIINFFNTTLEKHSYQTSTIHSNTQEALEAIIVPLSPEIMELIMWELVDNACKFHPTNQPTLSLEIAVDKDKVWLKLQDDGLTLSPEQLMKLWTPYYQAEANFTGNIQGFGLGLAAIASILWSVGGTGLAQNRDDGPGIIITLEIPRFYETDLSTISYTIP